MKNDQNQTTNTGNIAQPTTRATRRGRRLTLDDAVAVASLCAKRASEREACAHLGISYSTWAHYKSKNSNAEQFTEILDAIKGAKIAAHLENIELASKKDWRASECYLEKTMPDRFSNRAAASETTVNQTAIVIQAGGEENLRRMIEHYAGLARQTKALPAPALAALEQGDTDEK